MASLTTHLRRPNDHGRLEFHPECPVCRDERLAGTLPADALIGHRTQALLAAGVLAVTTAAPAAVFAAEPDQQQEGTAAPEQVPADAAPSDPGGGSDDLPFDVGLQVQAAPESTDTVALEQEPAVNEDAPTADAGDGTGMLGADSQQAPENKDAAAPPSALQPDPSTEPPETPAQTVPQAPAGSPPSASIPETPVEPDVDTTAAPRERDTARKRAPRSDDAVPQIVQAAPAPQPPAAESAPTTFQAGSAGVGGDRSRCCEPRP